MKLDAALTSYFFAKELAPRSREWYNAKITAFIRWCEQHTCSMHQNQTRQIEEVDTNLVREFFAYLRETPSTAINHAGRPPSSQTIHGYARAIKAWLNWCIEEDLVAVSVVKRLAMPKKEQRIIEVFTQEQIVELYTACVHHYNPVYRWLMERDKTILTVLLDTGIRASELCSLTLDSVRLSQGDSYIIVNGKGLKQRECPLGQRARLQVHRYIHQYRPNTEDNHVFLTRDRRGLKLHGLTAILERLKQTTEMTGVRCSPHDFRHTFAFNYLANGGDILRLSRLLGHTDISVTAQYLKAFNSRDARRGYKSVADNILGVRHLR